MSSVVKGIGFLGLALRLIVLGGFALCLQQTSRASQSVVLTWVASTDATVAGYKIYYGTTSQNYTNSVTVGNVTTATISGLADGTTYYFAATTFDSTGAESGFSNEASFTTTAAVAPTNPIPPTDPVAPTGPTTPVTPTDPTTPITSTNPIVSTNAVSPTNPTNTVTSKPSKPVVAAPLPTLNAIANMTVNKNAGLQTVNLSGITFSGNPLNIVTPNMTTFASKSAPMLKVTVTTSNPKIIPQPTINYSNPKNTGTLTFKPVANAFGTVTITVTVNNGAVTNNIVTRSFKVTVAPNPLDYPRITKQLANNSVLAGKTVTLSVVASGLAPLKYQWQLNGVNISTATSATLTLKNVKTAQTGQYSVIVSNPVGSTNSAPSQLSVYATLAQLEAPPATAAMLTSMVKTGGQFGFQVTGTAGSKYVVQATSDMKNWVSVQTNTSPFTFTDKNTGSYAQRFYRAYPSQ